MKIAKPILVFLGGGFLLCSPAGRSGRPPAEQSTITGALSA
jgi:hypothetical protein